MISDKMQGAINEQIKWEFYSAYLYLSMAAYFKDKNLPGFANWMMVQAQEETTHAMKFYNFLCDRGGKVQLQAVDGPPVEWSSIPAVFEETLNHERHVTQRINGLMDQAISENDHATRIFLQWFVTEQVEEEASVDELLKKLKLMGDGGNGLFMLDRELAGRVFNPPAPAAQ